MTEYHNSSYDHENDHITSKEDECTNYETFETWAAETVVTADLVVGSLLKKLRDTGIAGRELAEYVSLDDIDGPAKQIIDTMLTALTQTKKSRFVASDYFRSFGAGKT